MEEEDFPQTMEKKLRSCAESFLDTNRGTQAGDDSAPWQLDPSGTTAGDDFVSLQPGPRATLPDSDSANRPAGAAPASRQPDTGDTPAAVQFYNYGLALIDGQFWEEAIQELSMAAGLGFEPLKCRELCGDCAVKLARWQEAFHFYQCVYSDETLGEEYKKTILAKITKCSQEQKKEACRRLTPGENRRGTARQNRSQ